jgi:hypothetical protein
VLPRNDPVMRNPSIHPTADASHTASWKGFLQERVYVILAIPGRARILMEAQSSDSHLK